MSSHTKGLAQDWMTEATVVLANGTVVTASEKSNAELFWGLRGAGSNFGIVSEYKFNTFEPPQNLTAFEADIPVGTQAQAKTFLENLRNYTLNTMPAELNMRFASSFTGAELEGVYYGDVNGLKSALDPLLKPAGASVTTTTYADWPTVFQAWTYGATVDSSHPYNMV